MQFHKILVTAMLGMLAGTHSFAKTVDENTARTVGMNFLDAKGMQISSKADLDMAYTATSKIKGATIASYYVFNVPNGHAFVMVAADDRIRPILAYSKEAGFDMNVIAPSAKDWIAGYNTKIAIAISNNVAAKSATAGGWANLLSGATVKAEEKTTNVSPLLGTLIWNQAPYYNQYCPGGGVYQSPTGCVATSLAQVMKYWNWPTVGTGNYTYQCTSYGPSPLTLSANFGNTAYGWSSMPDELTSNVNAVGQLMFHAGVGVSMEYDTSESGAEVIELQSYRRSQCTEYALKTYFHYKRTLTGVPRNGQVYIGDSTGNIGAIAEADWISMLQNDLNAGHPIIYSGYGVLGGHAWVCDGWEDGGALFHFNWGWGGTGPNGYYSVDDLAPPTMGIGGGGSNFNDDQAVIIGIQPDSFPNTAGNLQLQAHLYSATSTPMSYGTPFSITTKILNSGSSAFTGDLCTQVFDTLNNLVGTIQTISGETIAAGATGSYTFGPSAMYAMVPMDYYHIQAMYRPAGTSTWIPVANNGDYINYTTADVTNDTDIALYRKLDITSPLPALPGAAFTFNTRLFNQGSNFNGTIQAVMINVATGTAYPVQSLPGQVIDSGTFLDVAFANAAFTAPDGLYALMVQHQYGGTGSIYTTSSIYYNNPVLVNVGLPSAVATVNNGHDVYVYPNPAKDMITILPQGVSITSVNMMDMQGRELQKQIQPNGKSAIMVPVSGMAPGAYFIRMQTTGNGTITRKIIIE